eukprot:1079111-Prorocentrum_minimum.AAC.2
MDPGSFLGAKLLPRKKTNSPPPRRRRRASSINTMALVTVPRSAPGTPSAAATRTDRPSTSEGGRGDWSRASSPPKQPSSPGPALEKEDSSKSVFHVGFPVRKGKETPLPGGDTRR